jgi:2-amino-4-hydroxy-6-hydroxymethyldihydropteridine diphosphokinase
MSQDTFIDKGSINVSQNRSILLVAVGSNMESADGSPRETTLSAVEKLRGKGAVIRAISRLYQTPAFPAGSGPDYVNGVFVAEADWTPVESLGHLHAVEAAMGRTRSTRWAQRVIDLDLLAMGDLVHPDIATARSWMGLPLDEQQKHAPNQLILPHPRLHERAFVLVPLADVAPDWVHPILRRSVRQMLSALPSDERALIMPITVPV